MQLAIGLLTASLDSPELEAWAVQALIPEDPAARGDFIAGLHVVSQLLLLLLHELGDATAGVAAACAPLSREGLHGARRASGLPVRERRIVGGAGRALR